MTFDRPLLAGVLRRRRQRFFADIELADGRLVTAHCPNTGSMRGCSEPGSRVYVSESDDPARRLAYTLELVQSGATLVGVHTGRTNRVVEEALRARAIPEFAGAASWRREVQFEDSRFDFRLEDGRGAIFVEVKNVTLVEEGVALFPDAVSVRGQKHLKTLARAVRAGRRAATLYVVPRDDARALAPADHIDPAYGRALRSAARCGVELLAWTARTSPRSVTLDRPIPVFLRGPHLGRALRAQSRR